jgi:hypothetical protein
LSCITGGTNALWRFYRHRALSVLQGLPAFYRSGVMQHVFSQIFSGCFRNYDIEHMLHQKNISFLKSVECFSTIFIFGMSFLKKRSAFSKENCIVVTRG